MIRILYLLLFSVTMLSAADIDSLVSSAAIAHYDSLLSGKVIKAEIEVKRVPLIKGENIVITSVDVSESATIPRGSTICWVKAEVDGRTRRIPVTLQINIIEMVPVALCDIQPRTELMDSLIQWEQRSTGQLGSAEIPNAEELKIYWSRAAIPQGEIITMNRLELEPEVTAGSKVTLVKRMGIVEVKTAGKALEDGLAGEEIKVLNPASGIRLSGIVQRGGLVLVE